MPGIKRGDRGPWPHVVHIAPSGSRTAICGRKNLPVVAGRNKTPIVRASCSNCVNELLKDRNSKLHLILDLESHILVSKALIDKFRK